MAVKNSLVQAQNKVPFSTYLTQDSIKKRINQMIGEKDGQRFIAAVVSAVTVNPALAECNHSTIFSAALLGESLKLSPSPQLGHYYMVPYNKKDKEGNIIDVLAQFQMGYKGYLQLAMRSGYYKKINVIAIKEGELRNYDPLNEVIDVMLIEDWDAREAAPTTGYYAVFEYLNGFRKPLYWSKKQMMAHADRYSPAFNAASYEKLLAGKIPKNELWKYSSFWYKSFDDMAFKTMLRQLISKWGIMSVEMQQAFERDDAILREDGSFEYVDDMPAAEPEGQSEPIDVEATVIDEPAADPAQESFFNE